MTNWTIHMLPIMIRELEDVSNPEQHSSKVLHVMLDYIFAGRSSEGWQLFDSYYSLSDKAEVRRRVKLMLNEHPVYKFIYNNRKNK